MTDKQMTNEMNDLKKLSTIINEARGGFNDILTDVLDELTRKLGSIYITFDVVSVDNNDCTQPCSFIDGYGRTTAFGDGFFYGVVNNSISLDSLDPASLVEALDTIIETAEPYKEED